MLIAADIASFALDQQTGDPVVVLKSVACNRTLAVAIGHTEAAAIAIMSLNVVSQLPLTIDLVKMTIDQLGGKLERVVVCDSKNGSGVARLQIAAPGGVHILECRISDAIALAMRCATAIFVEEILFEKGMQQDGASAQETLRSRIANSATQHFGSYFME